MGVNVQTFIDGVPLTSICKYGDVSWTDRWPLGNYDSSWTLGRLAGWRYGKFRKGAIVEQRYGASRLWLGELMEWDRDSGQMAATGLVRRGEDYDALVYDADLDAMVAAWNPRDAVDEAIDPTPLDRPPIGWTRDSTIPSVNLVSPAAGPDVMRLSDLLARATSRGHGTVYMGPDGVLRMLPDPTDVSWYVHPNVVDIGESAGEQRATHVYVDYLLASALSWVDTTTYSVGDIVTFNGDLWKRMTAGAGDIPKENSIHWAQLEVESWDPDVTSKTFETGTYYTLKDSTFYRKVVAAGPTAVAAPPTGWTNLGTLPTPSTLDVQDTTVTPYREERVAARGLGDLPFSEATAIANQALAVALTPAFNTDIPGTAFTAVDAYGNPANPVLFRAGTLGRVWGASHPHLSQPFIDVIAGEVTVSDAETNSPSAVVKPFGKEPQTDLEVMEAALNARRGSSV